MKYAYNLPSKIITSDTQRRSKQYISNPGRQRPYRFPLWLHGKCRGGRLPALTCRRLAATTASFYFTTMLFHLVYRAIVMS